MWKVIAIAVLAILQAPAGESPAALQAEDLKEFAALSESRQKLIRAALDTRAEVAGMPYLYGGNGAADGGFDCSGAMYFILRKVGLKAPRTSSAQFSWVENDSRMHLVPVEAEAPGHASFAHLQPGDLVFWAGTYQPTDVRKNAITHVAICLGTEVRDGHPVMINATNGRSYRGKKGNGLGVYDFRVPRKGGRSRLIGYGTPPGLEP